MMGKKRNTIQKASKGLGYVGITVIVNKLTGAKFRDEFITKDFSQTHINVDYCNSIEEQSYLGKEKEMIVIDKSLQKEMTIFFDESDRHYSSVTFLYHYTEDLSDHKRIAYNTICRATKGDNHLETILKNSRYTYIGIFLFQCSENEQLALKPQSEVSTVHWKEFGNLNIAVGRRIVNEFPDNAHWKKVTDISKVIVEYQNSISWKYFHENEYSLVKEKITQLGAKYANLEANDFFAK